MMLMMVTSDGDGDHKGPQGEGVNNDDDVMGDRQQEEGEGEDQEAKVDDTSTTADDTKPSPQTVNSLDTPKDDDDSNGLAGYLSLLTTSDDNGSLFGGDIHSNQGE